MTDWDEVVTPAWVEESPSGPSRVGIEGTDGASRIFFVDEKQGWILNPLRNSIGSPTFVRCVHRGEHIWIVNTR